MNAQGRDQKGTRDKFPEPQGWALKWDGFFQAATRQETCPTPGPEPERNNAVWKRFPEPQGWAARWDGSVLSELQEQQNGRAPSVEFHTDRA